MYVPSQQHPQQIHPGSKFKSGAQPSLSHHRITVCCSSCLPIPFQHEPSSHPCGCCCFAPPTRTLVVPVSHTHIPGLAIHPFPGERSHRMNITRTAHAGVRAHTHMHTCMRAQRAYICRCQSSQAESTEAREVARGPKRRFPCTSTAWAAAHSHAPHMRRTHTHTLSGTPCRLALGLRNRLKACQSHHQASQPLRPGRTSLPAPG